MKKLKWSFLTILILLLLSACGDKTYEGDFEYVVEEFTATNQNGEEVTNEDLKGKFWIADFMFTSCTDACPILTSNMSRLQQALKEEGIDARLVSFSADPNVDTPDVLKQYGESRGADFSNWDFLTGYSIEEIEKLSTDSFKVLATKMNGEVVHMNYFHLVTPEGKHIKMYKGMEAESVDKIVQDLKQYLD